MTTPGVLRAVVAALLPVALLVPLGATSAQAASKVVELSALQPSLSKNGWGPVERNRSNGGGAAGDGRRMTMAAQAYSTGLGVHAPSDLRFQVPVGCTRFSVTVGVDDEVGDRGSVGFQVFTGSTKRFDSGVLHGSSRPVRAAVPVRAGTVLRLVVVPGTDGARFDHADWASARFDCRTTGTAAAAQVPSAPAPATQARPSTTDEPSAPAPGGVPSAGWRPAFRDEFSGDRLDATKWADHDAWQAQGYGSDSAWFPVPHTARQIGVEGGVLTLRSRRANGLPEGKAFTSAHINSKDRFSIPAGATSYTEARIKAPSAAGTLPGFWLLGNGTSGDGGGWPITGEVDILEFANNAKDKGAPYFSVWYPKDVYTRAPGSFLNGTHDSHPATWAKRPQLLDSWHTWGLLRSPQVMELFIDGRRVASFEPGKAYGNQMPLPPMLFRNAQHLRLSLMVGGGWAGDGLTPAQFQEADLSVDYVRVWTR